MAWWWLLACGGPADESGTNEEAVVVEETTDPTDSSMDTSTSAALATAVTGHTGSGTGDTGAATTLDTAADEGLYPDQVYDCAVGVPVGPFAPTRVTGVETTEDFVFHTDGTLVASGANDVVLSYDAAGTATPVGPSLSSRPFEILPDERILVGIVNDMQIVELEPSTSSVSVWATIPTNIGALDADADGYVYAAYNWPGTVSVIDPSGVSTVIHEPAGQLYGITLSPDEQTLYASEYGVDGRLFRYERDATAPSGWSSTGILASLPGNRLGGGMATDICGNVYVVAPGDCSLWRAEPVGGTLERLYDGHGGAFCASIEFGSGLGGWDAHTLYMSTYEEVLAFDVGVPGRPR